MKHPLRQSLIKGQLWLHTDMGQASLQVLIQGYNKKGGKKRLPCFTFMESEREKACLQTQGPLFGFCEKPSD